MGLRRSIYWVVIGLTLLYLVPIWAFKYFPTQDGPCHLENSYMLLHYFDSDRAFSRYYNLNIHPLPNWFSHAAFTFLLIFLPPLTAEKALLTVYVFFFVVSIFYYLNSVGRDKAFFILLAFPFIYNWPLHKGFYNFAFSVPLVFLIIGYWLRMRDEPFNWGKLCRLNLLLIFLYFCNMLSHALAILAILVLALVHYRANIYRTLVLAFSLIPSYAAAFYYYVNFHAARHHGVWTWGESLGNIARIRPLILFDMRERYVSGALAVLYMVLFLYTLWRGNIWFKDKRPRIRVTENDAPLLLTAVFLFFYFSMTDNAYGGNNLKLRLCVYPFIMILPWLCSDLHRAAKKMVGAIACVLILAHLGFIMYYCKIFNDGLEEYTSGIPFVGKNETILPVSFDHDEAKSPHPGVYLHAAGYYCLEKGAIDLGSYEGNKRYFPLRYKRLLNPFTRIGRIEGMGGNIHPEAYPEPIAYILLWSPKGPFPALGWILRNYKLIHAKGRLFLYKRL